MHRLIARFSRASTLNRRWSNCLVSFHSTIRGDDGGVVKVRREDHPFEQRSYLQSVCDALWKSLRDPRVDVEPKQMLYQAPKLVMQHRAWSEFVNDGLLTVWLTQTLRPDVITQVTTHRLTYMALDMAKVINAAMSDDLASRRVLPEDKDRLYLLLNEMVDQVFVKRNDLQFKHISASTEALGRFVQLLSPPRDQVERWSGTLGGWIESGHLAPYLVGPSLGPTSLTSFLWGLTLIGCRPDDETLGRLAGCCRAVFAHTSERYPRLRAKALMSYVNAWQIWRKDPETFRPLSWTSWYRAYEYVLLRQRTSGGAGGEFEKQSVMVNLVQHAFVVARDYDRVEDLESVSKITEKQIKQFLDDRVLSPTRAAALLRYIEKLEVNRVIFSEQVLEKLRSQATNGAV